MYVRNLSKMTIGSVPPFKVALRPANPQNIPHEITVVNIGRFCATTDRGEGEVAQEERQGQTSPNQRHGGANARAAVELLQFRGRSFRQRKVGRTQRLGGKETKTTLHCFTRRYRRVFLNMVTADAPLQPLHY